MWRWWAIADGAGTTAGDKAGKVDLFFLACLRVVNRYDPLVGIKTKKLVGEQYRKSACHDL